MIMAWRHLVNDITCFTAAQTRHSCPYFSQLHPTVVLIAMRFKTVHNRKLSRCCPAHGMHRFVANVYRFSSTWILLSGPFVGGQSPFTTERTAQTVRQYETSTLVERSYQYRQRGTGSFTNAFPPVWLLWADVLAHELQDDCRGGQGGGVGRKIQDEGTGLDVQQ